MEPSAPDLSLQMPRDIYYQIVHSLRATLPPPVTDDPADLVRRDNAMIGRVAAMLPGNADEVAIAAQCVAADVQALDCLRLARTCGQNVELVLKCSARAVSMMRQANGARTLLLRLQAARQKCEADNTARDRAAWVEHGTLGLMADALGHAKLPPLEQPSPEQPAPLTAPPVTVPAAISGHEALSRGERNETVVRQDGEIPPALTLAAARLSLSRMQERVARSTR